MILKIKNCFFFSDTYLIQIEYFFEFKALLSSNFDHPILCETQPSLDGAHPTVNRIEMRENVQLLTIRKFNLITRNRDGFSLVIFQTYNLIKHHPWLSLFN